MANQLYYSDGTQWLPVANEGVSGDGATTLNQLTDVDTATAPPTDGQVLKYRAASGLWVPAPDLVGSGGTGGGEAGTIVYRGNWAAGAYVAGSMVENGDRVYVARVDTSESLQVASTIAMPFNGTVQKNGNAAESAGVITLINGSSQQGSAVDATVVDLNNFDVTADLNMSGIGDGMTFGIISSTLPVNTLGAGGGNLGFGTTFGLVAALDAYNNQARIWFANGTSRTQVATTAHDPDGVATWKLSLGADSSGSRPVYLYRGTTLICQGSISSGLLPPQMRLYTSAGAGSSSGTYKISRLSMQAYAQSTQWLRLK